MTVKHYLSIKGVRSGVEEEHLDSVVAGVCHVRIASRRVNGNASRTLELAVAGAWSPKLCDEVAAGVKHLYTVVLVCHIHAARCRVHGNAKWSIKPAVAGAMGWLSAQN